MPKISSPCVNNCCLDEDDICLGCGRTVAEIVRWNDATGEEKSEILAFSVLRKASRAAAIDEVK